jgi:hypothetical protein
MTNVSRGGRQVTYKAHMAHATALTNNVMESDTTRLIRPYLKIKSGVER